MTVSVLIPFYNREDFLAVALQSINYQTYGDWQAILYDDGSTDKSTEIAEDWLTKNPGYLIREEKNRGVGYARNRLLQLIDTPYACWMDSDDLSMEHRLEQQVKMIQEKKVDMVFSYLRFCRENIVSCASAPYKIDITKYTSREGLYNNMTFATGLFKKELSEYEFPEDIHRKEDVAWLVKLIEAKKTFAVVPEDLYHVRQHPNRLTPKT